MKNLLLIGILLIATITKAQVGNITGNIKSGQKPMAFVTVAIQNLAVGTVTDTQGNFILKDIPYGTHKVRISLIGYKTMIKEVAVNQVSTSFNVQLEEDLLQLQQVVITGTRSEIPMHQAPIITMRINSKMLQNTQSQSVADGLSFSPGLRVENNCNNCGFTQLRMNGLDGAYTQILINSRPVFSALAGVYGLELFPAAMIDRVEIVKGGGSVMYGANAIGGTVNLITKNPQLNTFELGVNQAFTNFEASDRTVNFNGSLVNNAATRGVSFYAFNRNRKPWDSNNDGFTEITNLENTTVGIDAFWDLPKDYKIKLNAYHITEFRRGGNKLDLPPHQSDITEQLNHDIYGLGLSMAKPTADKNGSYQVYFSAQSTQRKSYYGAQGRILVPGDSLSMEDVLAINAYGSAQDISVATGFQYNYATKYHVDFNMGTELQYNGLEDQLPAYGRSISQQASTWGNYAQVTYHPGKRLTLLGGARLDLINIQGLYDFGFLQVDPDFNKPIVVPRLSAMYQITENLKARTSFAQGYRAPQTFNEDLHIETVGGATKYIFFDNTLKPERSNSFTGSLNYTKLKDKYQVNVVFEGFLTLLNNPFILSNQQELPSGVAVIQKRNGDGARVMGTNLEFNYSYNDKITIQSGFTLQTALYNSAEIIWEPESITDANLDSITSTNRILRTPNTYGYLNFNYAVTKNWDIIYSLVHTGSMDVAHVIDPDTEFTTIKSTPNFLEHNLKIDYKLNKEKNGKMVFSFGIQNLTNSYQKDFDVGINRDAAYVYGPMRPRTIFFGVRYLLDPL